MTVVKIAITLPPEQLARAKAAVREGRAESVSAYIASALERQAALDTMDGLLRDLIAEHGAPSAQDRAWAKRAFKGRRRASRSTPER